MKLLGQHIHQLQAEGLCVSVICHFRKTDTVVCDGQYVFFSLLVLCEFYGNASLFTFGEGVFQRV